MSDQTQNDQTLPTEDIDGDTTYEESGGRTIDAAMGDTSDATADVDPHAKSDASSASSESASPSQGTDSSSDTSTSSSSDSSPESGAGDGDEYLGADTPGQASDTVKDPSDWVTGDEPMTGAQRSYLDTLARRAGEQLPADLNKAEASEHIDRLQSQTGTGGASS